MSVLYLGFESKFTMLTKKDNLKNGVPYRANLPTATRGSHKTDAAVV